MDYTKGLNRSGYGDWGFNVADFNMERIDAIRSIIRPRLEKCKKCTAFSYSLKMRVEHQIEAIGDVLGGYVQNGELIYAMILEGFKPKKDGINAYFNVTESSLARLPRYPEYTLDGDVYDGDEKWNIRRKPVFKIDAERYHKLLTSGDTRIKVIKSYE